MIGRLIAPTSAKMAAARCPWVGLSKARMSAIWPRYRKNSTSTEVSRASHTQYAPHIGLPQSEPETRQTKVKPAPTGPISSAARSASGWRQMIEKNEQTANAA
jgi:hypothetical protein